MNTAPKTPSLRVLYAVSASLVLVMAGSAKAQVPACDNCAEPCPLSIPGLYIYNPQQGHEILSFGFEANTCLYDESGCDALIQCDPWRALDEVEAGLASLDSEEQITRYLKTFGSGFKLLKGRDAVTLYGCGESVSAVIPVAVPITRTYWHRVDGEGELRIKAAPVVHYLTRKAVVPAVF